MQATTISSVAKLLTHFKKSSYFCWYVYVSLDQTHYVTSGGQQEG